MLRSISPSVFLLLCVFVAAGASPRVGAAEPGVASPAATTKVGGELLRYGEKLAVVRDANHKVLAAAPRVADDLAAAWRRVADGPTTRGFGAQLAFAGASLVLLSLVAFAMRRATARYRLLCDGDPVCSRGAAALFGLDVLDRIVVAACAYLLIELWCDIESTNDVVAVALLWAFVRWWILMLPVQALLRPRQPQFRLVPMGDDTALALTRVLAVVSFAGIVGISVIPVLLKAELPVTSAQFLALVQGVVVAAGGMIAAALFRRNEYRRAARPDHRPRLWFYGTMATIVVVWLAWSIGVLLLEFSIYHSLVWTVRIAVYAYIVDSMLCMSATAQAHVASNGKAPTPLLRLWIPLLHRTIRVAAILAISILLAETWLVDELELVARADWEPVRHSLITASLTLLAGYFFWCYLHQLTEDRLRSVARGFGEADDGNDAAPASRLTTVLPVLRILLGVTIVVMAVLVALSQLGVNIAPLLAGAGVIGLAISFGSQALVRDIVSGIFFMTDDAFRIGEYIDTGRLKGTVEKISLRSLRLRHQNGQIHTIPFGQLTAVTNFSRDWQTVKFNLRLARDSDMERVRRTVKQIGLAMMEDPELGKELLQPLKLQGVAEIADNAIVVRFKFTARPSKPGLIQREALKRIYQSFGEKGIEFASNAITVQTAGATPAAPQAVAGAGAYGAQTKRTDVAA
jgi:small-conductance mechanosensitive channel